MTASTPARLRRHALRQPLMTALSGLLLAGLAPLAQAQAATGPTVPLSVRIDGLPPGLAPVLTSTRVMCNEGVSYLENPDLRLSESTLTVYERVTLPSGQPSLRARTVTRYVGNFQLPYGPQPGDLPNGVATISCGSPLLGGLDDNPTRLAVKVPGLRAGVAAVQTVLATEVAVPNAAPAPLTLHRSLSARTESLSVPTAQVDAMARGMQHSVVATLRSDLAGIERPTLSLTTVPTSTAVFTLPRTLAQLVLQPDNRACVVAGGVTRCLGDQPGPVLHGGLRLLGVTLAGSTARFSFELLQSFPVGPVRLVAAARSKELDQYSSANGPVPAPLLPWQAKHLDMRVQ